MFRRSSYASVAAGTANPATSSQSINAPTRSGAFSHLIGQNQSGFAQHPSRDHSRNPSRGGTEIDGIGGGMGSFRGGVLSGSGNMFGNGYYGGQESSEPAFFVPSYLEGSRYAEKVRDSYNARLIAQRDSRNAYPSGTGALSTSSSSVNLHKMVPSHRGMTHDIIERAPPAASHSEDKVRSWPTRWNDADKFNGLDLLKDGMEVKFGGLSKSHDEAPAVRSDHPMPKQCGIYYYEVTVLSKGKDGSYGRLIGIGFSGANVDLNRLPGWEPHSWAYHGDDGFSFCCTASGKSYGPKFTSLDVIGCGVNFKNKSAFFTKNGVYLGTAFRNLPTDKDLFPAVGVKKAGEHLRVNFGQTPFVFDIDNMVKQEQLQIQREISNTSVTALRAPLDETSLIHELIAQYLAHDGYVDTARAFAAEAREESRALTTSGASTVKDLEPEEDIDAINRQKIRAAILEGDIDKALKYTNTYYPNVLPANENVYFKLRCRKFIEMYRTQSGSSGKSFKNQSSNGHDSSAIYDDVFDSNMDLDDGITLPNANNNNPWDDSKMDTTESENPVVTQTNLLEEMLQYGRELKSEFAHDPRREVKRALEETFALLAYPDARESALAPLLEPSERVPVAEELNSAILVSLGKNSSAALERLCQQTEALIDVLGEDGGAGAFVNMRRDFLQTP
ncbi:ran-binding protein [Saccharata proteae CBS 121410]|uniref:Ran-binding protein n=1 Tax=Saccharata proteae CBS 121410 TaxID=1314787 RepID=A0A9P4HXX4_9PEZI|nr:ran-binding protein [Saccharata proteae CBS 121410]